MSEDAADVAGRDADEDDGATADADVDADGAGEAEDGATADATEGGADPVADVLDAEEPSPSVALADLADRVAEYDESLAADVADAAERVETVETAAAEHAEHVEELEARLKRKQADFENYKKRSERKQAEIRERATEDFVERVVGVRDNLVRALGQDEDAGLRDGIESTLAEFDDVLAAENVEPIEPDPGDDLDPVRHEVLMRTESDRPDGTVVDCYRPGYEMAGRVIQTAQVTVSEGSSGGAGTDEDPTGGTDG